MHLVAVVVPLLGESKLTLVLLARLQVLLKHCVLVGADLLFLPSDPFPSNLLGFMLLFLDMREVLLQLNAIFFQLPLGLANTFILLAQLIFLELELVSLLFLKLFELNDLLGDFLLTDYFFLFELAEFFVLLAKLLHPHIENRLLICAILGIQTNEFVEAGADLLLLLMQELVSLGEVLVGLV